jgi:predicted alpha/beta superfamily hydrolase
MRPFSASFTKLKALLPQSHVYNCYVSTSTSLIARKTLIYGHSKSHILPTCDISLGMITVSAPEAGDFVELILI